MNHLHPLQAGWLSRWQDTLFYQRAFTGIHSLGTKILSRCVLNDTLSGSFTGPDVFQAISLTIRQRRDHFLHRLLLLFYRERRA